MFATPNVRATFKAMKLRLVNTDEGQKRLAELVFVVEPFTSALANEIDAALADHLFAFPQTPASSPRGDVLDLKFATGSALFSLRMRFVPDDDAAAVVLKPVGVAPLKAHVVIDSDGDADHLTLTLTVAHEVDPSTDLRGLVHLFGLDVYLTFAALQGKLFDRVMDAITDPSNEAVKDFAKKVAKQGHSVSIQTPGGKRLDISADGRIETA